MAVYSNIVKKDKLRKVQKETLQTIKDALTCSFGPYGSNTLVYKDATLNTYTKDGHDIMKGIKIMFPIESSVQRDLVEITQSIVKNSGDGTTSAVILSSEIFNQMIKLEDKYTPYTIIREFQSAVDDIKEEILRHTKEFDAEMAYKISMISTNGNEEVSNIIKDIYTKHGNDVYISLQVTTQNTTMIKEYDGLTMKEGIYNSAYMNMPEEGKAQLQNASIYYFDDPVDTPNMMACLEHIVMENIFNRAKVGQPAIPTVILTPFISRDMSTYIEKIESVMNSAKGMNKPPLIIINNIFKNGNVDDIVKMCGCKPIKKYIDLAQQKEDIEKGLAPSLETVTQFCGHADMVVSTTSETKFINPEVMVVKDENGLITGYSDEYHALVNFLETEIKNSVENDLNVTDISKLKSRLHGLKSNLVEFIIGGLSLSDREATKALVEDAILNCRSASEHGVGYGANFEGLRSSFLLSISKVEDDDNSRLKIIMYNAIHNAYREVQKTLLKTAGYDDSEINHIIANELSSYINCPFNLVTEKYDGEVLSSIMTDPVILDSIGKLLTLLITCNQFLVENPTEMGAYADNDKVATSV